MRPDIFQREFHILTTVGGLPADEAIEFLSKAASAAKGVCHQSTQNVHLIPDMPGGTGRKGYRPALSQMRQSR